MKTSKLIGPALAWAVGVAEGCRVETWHTKAVAILFPGAPRAVPWNPHSDWSQGGPIIERERICLDQPDDLRVRADCQAFIRICVTGQARRPHYVMSGPTPLVAAMRCYVACKLGDDVEIPEELQ